jgi:hypothetical protein
LARETAGDDIDQAAPRPTVECPHVVVNLEWRQCAVVNALAQHLAAVGVNLDRADRLVAKQHSAEDAAARAREQMQLP